MPILFSDVVNLHPVAIIVAILIFGGLWGLVYFAIPSHTSQIIIGTITRGGIAEASVRYLLFQWL